MKFYKEMDFHETPIGKIPKEWNVTKLSDLIVIETGKRARGGALSEGSVASIGGEHIDNEGNIRWDNMKFIPEDFYYVLKQGKVTLGDVLLVKDGATTGKVAMVKKLRYEKVAVNEHVFVIRSKTNKLINEFLFYFLFSKFGQVQIKTRFHGMIGGIVRKDLETMLLPLPSHKEQQKIAEFVIAKTERLKKGLMQTLLTRGIGHKEYKQTPIGTIPKTWQVVRLKEVSSDFIGGGTPSTSNPDYWDGNIAWMTSAHINGRIITSGQRYITKKGLENSATNLIAKDNLIIATRVGIGKAAVNKIDIAISQDLTGVIVDKDKALPEFLYWVIINNERKLKSIAQGSTIKGILREDLGRLLIPKPPLQEQKEIANILSTIDRKLEVEKAEKSKLDRV